MKLAFQGGNFGRNKKTSSKIGMLTMIVQRNAPAGTWVPLEQAALVMQNGGNGFNCQSTIKNVLLCQRLCDYVPEMSPLLFFCTAASDGADKWIIIKYTGHYCLDIVCNWSLDCFQSWSLFLKFKNKGDKRITQLLIDVTSFSTSLLFRPCKLCWCCSGKLSECSCLQ